MVQDVSVLAGTDCSPRVATMAWPCPSSLALVILAGLIHAVWNIAAKKAGGDARFATFTGLLMALIWAPLGIWLGWDVLPTWGSVRVGARRRQWSPARGVLTSRCCAATATPT